MFRSVFTAMEKRVGIRIVRDSSDREARLADLSPEMRSAVERAIPYTMTSPERLTGLCMAVEHVVANGVPGAFVECGVWRGGSSMVAALTYLSLGHMEVDLCLFDTFEGMSRPSEEDVSSSGELAADLLANNGRNTKIWAYSPIEDVRRNLLSTGYPENRIQFIKGMVEETIPGFAPEQISILRLDTDWYESTKHELIHLFPRLSRNGILIIDDYGHWAGARKAVDEYFASQGMKPFLSRLDNTGRIYVKC
jgi:O-methyltransferase